MQWFVQVSGQVYGPYDNGAMQSFVSEGRVNAASKITNDPSGGFYDAAAYDIYNFWAGTGQARVNAPEPTLHRFSAISETPLSAPLAEPKALDATPEAERPEALSKAASAQGVFTIMAEIRSGDTMAFLQTLQSFGRVERIGETLWALRGLTTVEQLRNALSSTLGRQDRMFIVDSVSNRTAWFNIGADLDKRIRDLWDES